MVRARRLYRCLPAALVSVVLLACAGGARAETYGELGHFGSAGTARGQFKLVGAPNKGTHAFGVVPTDNTVYVGDEPEKRKYRIQKFTASGQFLAETGRLEPPNRFGIEGIAVDPSMKRIYMLALERRSETAKLDPAPDGAAGTLYAFSTSPSGETLVPAAGTNSEGVLVGPSEFEAASEVPEKALLNPAGISVDPTTHDVIVLGEVDTGSKQDESQLIALQRVHSDGTFGERYVDRTDFFAAERVPASPVVSSVGDVYVGIEREYTGLGEFVQVPSDFSSEVQPVPFVQFATLGGFPGENYPIVGFPLGEPAKEGGGLALSLEGPGDGIIYTKADVLRDGIRYPGVLAFDGASGAEIGWTGGQTKNGGESCLLATGEPTYSVIAAGREHTVFVLDAASAHVMEFGPEGEGCPTAEASEPAGTIDGAPLTPGETISPGTLVTFSSMMTQANALSVEWNFGDGKIETVSADEYQHTEVAHAFARGGELTVTETIHTDDLATPTIVKQTKVSVSNVAVPPTAVLEGPLELTLGTSGPQRLVYLEGGGYELQGGAGGEGVALASFDGSASFDSNPSGSNRIVSYQWVFGDGSSETTETPAVTHAYKQVGDYKVELTVTDALGQTSEPSALAVKVNPPPPAPATVVHQPTAPSLVPPPAVVQPTTPATAAPAPLVGLASTSLASRAGVVRMIVTCPQGETTCAGSITLRTLDAVGARVPGKRSHSRKPRAAVLTLATGGFTVRGGHQKAITLYLTIKGRLLLAHAHELRARATIVAHDGAGATHTAQSIVTVRATKSAHVQHGP